jgi:sulfhydrogenase subunit beta (sulfur reductase)
MAGSSWLPREDLDRLIELLRDDGRRVIGPAIRDGAIVYDDILSAEALPAGVGDVQSPGRYRLTRNGGTAAAAAKAPTGTVGKAPRTFDFASSPMSWKQFTFPASVPLGEARRKDGKVSFHRLEPAVEPMAFLGVRACDLAALDIHDTVLTRGLQADQDYDARRSQALTIAVECATPSGTCFCSSMGTGPEVTNGFDLALTELDDGFVVRAGTRVGHEMVTRLGLRPASGLQQHAAAGVPIAARSAMAAPDHAGVVTSGLKERLLAQLESPHWETIAERCLACTSCTMVCPTCFCTGTAKTTDLGGEVTTTERHWDSCFTLSFARVAGGNSRPRVQDRYRQWLTHKFATWVDQFGTFGCVGCGRCVTWCPVGIDVREELAVVAPVEELAVVDVPTALAVSPARFALAQIMSVERDTADTSTLHLGDLPDAILGGAPGQFLMLDLPGFSSVPISISRYRDDGIELTIRIAGASTRAIVALPPGTQLGVSGPFGRGWPLDMAAGRDLLIVAGGIGIAPLRPVMDAIRRQRDRFGQVRLCYGARTPGDLLYTEELEAWAERDGADIGVTVDRADARWKGTVGVVTMLFDRAPIDGSHATAFVCGPERMMFASSLALAGRGLLAERIFLSMERHMQCGLGLCGHCQMGRYFVCRDGPVFSRAELGESMAVEGI